MIFYKVYEDDYSYGEYQGDDEVRYYLSHTLAEEDLNKRREEWPTCPAKIREIRTED
jgi:hypothetical protein